MTATTAPVRLALLGAGLIGREHATLIAEHPEAILAGIAEVGDAGRAVAASHGVPCYDDFRRLLDEIRPDGVIVALPNGLHREAGLACIERRLPVLIEKPITDTVASAFELVEAAEAAGVPVLVGHHRRHSPDIRAAHQAITRGDIGPIVAINGLCLIAKHDSYFEARWRREPGGGPLLINAIHDIDCFRHLCGEIEAVQAFASSATRGFAVEDTVAVSLRFRSGALGTFILSDATPSPYFWETASGQALYFPPHPADSYVVAGRRGTLAVPSLDLWHHRDGGDWREPLQRRRPDPAPGSSPSSCYVAQLDNLIAVIRGTAAPVVSGRDGAGTLAATLAIQTAIVEGRSVRVADLLPP